MMRILSGVHGILVPVASSCATVLLLLHLSVLAIWRAGTDEDVAA